MGTQRQILTELKHIILPHEFYLSLHLKNTDYNTFYCSADLCGVLT